MNDLPLAHSRRATRTDVARRAGVSPAVVTYTLNGSGPVSAKTAQRVKDAVEELGYRPNLTARALKMGSTRTLAVIVPDGTNPFFNELAQAVELEARRNGYALYMTTSPSNDPATLQHFLEFANRQVDGVLIVPGEGITDAEELNRIGMPWVLLDASAPFSRSISVDLYAGAFAAVQHLIEHGYDEIGFVGTASPEDLRFRGWQSACRAAGLEPRIAIESSYTPHGGRAAADRLVAGERRPRAVFVASDTIAIGVLKRLHEVDIAVPDEIAIVSFDGSRDAEYAWPGLTTLAQPITHMAQEAVRLVLRTGDEPAGHQLFEGSLILRESCGAHRP
ncbi:substrate-binding domain-containing protein [Glaciibacter superstes]|uniref:substrate-binding domain-containing protein n=1 Tax=Glaciibacter superstes TaxID=501023 RepID=UPI0003B323B0